MTLKRLRIATVLLASALALPALAATPLAPEKVKINELVQDLQRASSSPDTLDMVWWIPEEFWAASFASDSSIDEDTKKEFRKLFRKYTVIAAVKGDIGALGVDKFESEQALRDKLRIHDEGGKSIAPIPADKVDPKLTLLIQVMRPMFKNVLGTMGDNLQFFVFPEAAKGGRIADPLGQGRFTVMLGEVPYVFRLPLGSLLVPQRDPATGEVFPGSFSYNPYTGAALRADTP